MKIKLGVIFGGSTVEHEVSIITACQAMSFINQEKYDIIPIYISKDRIWYTGKMLMDIEVFRDFDNLKKYSKKVVLTKTKDGFVLQKTTGLFRKTVAELDIVLPLVHGKGVEDGSVAGYLDLVGIPYAESSIIGSSIGQDKVLQKQIMTSSNIPTPDYCWFYDSEYLEDSKKILKNIEELGYPVIVKPANLGSSVGISVAHNEKDVIKSIEDAIQYDNKILVEKMIDHLLEVNISVLGNYEYAETSAIAEMATKNDFLTYSDKYLSDGGKKGCKSPKSTGKIATSSMKIPANLKESVKKQVEELALKTFKVLNLSGDVRIDFLIDTKNEKVYVNEPNIIPGSLAFYLWKPVGKDYATLLDDIITIGIKEYKAKNNKVTSFESNILSTYQGGSKGMKNKMGQ